MMINYKVSARLYGIFFILSFLSYAIGTGLLEEVQQASLLLRDETTHRYPLMVGGILIGFFHTLFNVGLLAIMFRVLKSIHQTFACLYMVLGFFGTVMLAFGAVFLLMPVSVAENTRLPEGIEPMLFETLLRLCANANFYSYQLGMMVWGAGGLILCYLLYQSQLVPRLFPVIGTAAYLIFMAGTILELFGYPYGVILSLPGGLFEIALSIWLIVKGFSVEKQVT